MACYLSPIGNEAQIDSNGNPVSGGKIYTYLAGTSTPAATYTDDTGSTPQANPIVLNSAGLPASPIWLQGGTAYKFVFDDANGVQYRPTVDDITGINDPAAVGGSVSQWLLFSGAPTYISATSFSLAGDQTLTFTAGRRLRLKNTGGIVTGTILTSAFGSVTTITLANDSGGALDSGLSEVSYGILTSTANAIPANPYYFEMRNSASRSTTGVFTTYTLQTSWCNGGGYVASAGSYTVPLTGAYTFTAVVGYSGTPAATGPVISGFRANGAHVGGYVNSAYGSTAANQNPKACCTLTRYFSAGDVIDFEYATTISGISAIVESFAGARIG